MLVFFNILTNIKMPKMPHLMVHIMIRKYQKTSKFVKKYQKNFTNALQCKAKIPLQLSVLAMVQFKAK